MSDTKQKPASIVLTTEQRAMLLEAGGRLRQSQRPAFIAKILETLEPGPITNRELARAINLATRVALERWVSC